MKYYIKSNGKTFGPIEENKIKDRLRSGFFSYNSHVSVDLKEWLPLQQCISIPQSASGGPDSGTAHDSTNVEDDASSLLLTGNNVVHPASDPQEDNSFHFNTKLAIVIIISILLILILGIFLVVHRLSAAKTIPARPDRTTAPTDFQQVCKLYQSSVGVVMESLEDSDGKLVSSTGDLKVSSDYPAGMVFAIDKDKFATNCHVANGVKNQKSGVLEAVLRRIVFSRAQDNGVKNREDFLQYYKNGRG